MKKMTLLLMLVVVAMISFSANRTGTIKTGKTMLDVPMSFGATDTIGTGETVTIIVTSEQVNPSKQNMYTTLTTVSGSPSVAIKLWGKCFSGDAYVQIGATQTWTSASNNPVNITATTPNQYRYFKAEYVCSGTTQEVKITAFELKLWLTSGLASSGTLTDGTATINSGAIADVTTIAASGRITGTGGATITGAVTNINATSNFATNIGTGTTNAAVTIGNAANTIALVSPTTVTGLLTTSAGINTGTSQTITGTTGVTLGAGTETVAINSSDWDISATGAMTGIGAITADGLITASAGLNTGTSQTITGTTAVTLGAGTETVAINSSDWDIGATGNVSGIGTFEQDGIYTMGTSASALVKALTSASLLAHSVNIESQTNPSSEVSLLGGYSKVSNTTIDQPNLQLVGFAPRVSMGKNALDAYGLQSHITLVDGASSTGNMTAVSGKSILYDNNAAGIVTAGLFTLEGQASGTHGAVPRVPSTAYGIWADIVDVTTTAGVVVNANNSTVGSGLLLTKSGTGAYTAEITLSTGLTILSGTATTRQLILDSGENVAIGSMYLSSGAGGKTYIKVAHTNAVTDWNLVTTSAAD